MKVHGIGHGCAGISFLHAAGCGKGCAVPIDLVTTVMLTDSPTPIPEDESGLLGLLLEGWSARNLSLPIGELGWVVKSEIPIGMGLKSSTALLVAAQRALCDATQTNMSAAMCNNLLSSVQLAAGVSITEAIDDITVSSDSSIPWLVAATDVADPLSEPVIVPMKEVFIVIRNQPKAEVNISEFHDRRDRFEDVVRMLRTDRPIEAFRLNGHLVAEALGDDEGTHLCEDLEIETNCPAAITGSGPAIVVLADANQADKLTKFLDMRELNWIRTRMSIVQKFEVVT
jgi:shikimate kinase